MAERTITEHAAEREAAWLVAHPEGHIYETKDLRKGISEELADAYNYLLHWNLSGGWKAYFLAELAHLYQGVQRAEPKLRSSRKEK